MKYCVTPVELIALLTIYVFPDGGRTATDRNAYVVRNLVNKGLIEPGAEVMSYQTTEKGRTLVDGLCRVAVDQVYVARMIEEGQ